MHSDCQNARKESRSSIQRQALGSLGIRSAFAVLLLTFATVATWFWRAEDLAAAPNESDAVQAEIRLQAPSFGAPSAEQWPRFPADDEQTPMATQSVAGNVLSPPEDLVIQSRQDALSARELWVQQQSTEMSSDNPPAVPLVAIVPHAPKTQPVAAVSDTTDVSDTTEAWSVPPEKPKSTPAQIADPLSEEQGHQWSIKPEPVDPGKYTHVQQVRPMPDQDRSLPPANPKSTLTQTEPKVQLLQDPGWSLLPDNARAERSNPHPENGVAARPRELSVADRLTPQRSQIPTPPAATSPSPATAVHQPTRAATPVPVDGVPSVLTPDPVVPATAATAQSAPNEALVPQLQGGNPTLPQAPSQVSESPLFNAATPQSVSASPGLIAPGQERSLIQNGQPNERKSAPEPVLYQGHSFAASVAPISGLGGHSVFDVPDKDRKVDTGDESGGTATVADPPPETSGQADRPKRHGRVLPLPATHTIRSRNTCFSRARQ